MTSTEKELARALSGNQKVRWYLSTKNINESDRRMFYDSIKSSIEHQGKSHIDFAAMLVVVLADKNYPLTLAITDVITERLEFISNEIKGTTP